MPIEQPVADQSNPASKVLGEESPEDPKILNSQNMLLLVKRMKQTDPSPKTSSGTDWHPLGELELGIDEKNDDAVRAWIEETLGPLNPNADFLNRILRSAQEAVTRAAITDGATSQLEHLHLLIYTPIESTPTGKTWGFFRIEKVGIPTADTRAVDHSIEFYLYREGQ